MSSAHRAALRTLGLLSLFATACSSSAGMTAADAADVIDALALNDLSADHGAPSQPEVGASDVPREASVDASIPLYDGADVPVAVDAGVDAPVAMDAGADVPFVTPDVGFDAGPADVPGVFFGDLFVPVDPNAVPAPGSECASDGGVAAGDPSIAPPRPIRPLSVSRVMSQRPSFQWALPDGTTGARVQVCADRCCTRVLQSFDADGTTGRLPVALAPGVVFWRMFGRRGTVVGARASYTWEFGVRHRDTPTDSSWGTIHDFNGDGYDDLIARVQTSTRSNASTARIALGSATGLTALRETGIGFGYLPSLGSVGDFNGDGISDFVAYDSMGSSSPARTSFAVVEGTLLGLRLAIRSDASGVGECAGTGGVAAVDWNGDGYSDVVTNVEVGCNLLVPPTAAFLFVYFGSAAGTTSIPQAVVRVDERFNFPEVYVYGGLGDLDLDGFGDVFLLSAHSGAGTSSVPNDFHVAHGSSGGMERYDRVADPQLPEAAYLQAFPVGDMDGDGYGELSLVDSPHPPVYLYRPVVSLERSVAVLRDPAHGDYFGAFVTAGDANGDGLSDLIISSETAVNTMSGSVPVNVGRVYVYVGARDGSIPEPIWVARSHSPSEMIPSLPFGEQTLCPGDVNGDGFDDIVMGDAYMYRFCVLNGRANLMTGSPDLCVGELLGEGVQAFF